MKICLNLSDVMLFRAELGLPKLMWDVANQQQ